MTEVEQLGEAVARASWEMMSPEAVLALKARILDAVGCALGALQAPPVAMLRAQVEELGGAPNASLIGGGRTAPDRAAFYNGALVRYLDFNDSFLAPGETCHPSDNLGAVLAASEYAGQDGKGLLTALAVAYQVQCRLSEAAPVRARGFDHVTHGAYAAAAGAAKALGLDAERIANAVAMSGTAYNALRVTRTGRLSHWKGLAAANAACGAVHAALLARHGITGPLELFEGNKGFKEAIAGPFHIDWLAEDLEAVRRTSLKRYDAEVHAQAAVEGILELAARERIQAADVSRVEIDVFDVAFAIIGGGEEGDKRDVRTREQADHSLPYMIAAAILDHDLGPAQYSHERIGRDDVQQLLRRVVVRSDPELSERFPRETPVRIRVGLGAGRELTIEKRCWEGHCTRPMPWERVVEKFERLAGAHATPALLHEIIVAVGELEQLKTRDLMGLLVRTGRHA